uniref:16S rRNA (cytosine(967)-C(5))-methyltransferase n=1 Tax=Candidatus Kentrum sp. TUN TaxID=2126343 RepID=A0A450ZFF8_9GAMM|nr:MAG: 16S rRNA (cytosine967-C5)-methyltransferase [Candidatus Kentron sp. TUN]VFK52545.1 MAG: 16S rRNA (cytosine967-C5)-methyltransferase [Candidatus Kentron sp. TUN]VFK52864.1 MAG: 16S rRNA (cytosine967-C5)-methyltransferase [Candidatus Kentron sp. TUN]
MHRSNRPNKKKVTATGRSTATDILVCVLGQGHSLTTAFPKYIGFLEDPRERAFAKELSFGVMRWLPRLQALVTQLVNKSPWKKDPDVGVLLLLGLYQLIYLRLPSHAAIAETVAIADFRKKSWAKGFINAVLRGFQRKQEELLERVDREVHIRLAHPRWLVAEIRDAWPQDWESILSANNQQAPMALRVNVRRASRDAYLERFFAQGASVAVHAESGIRLHKAMDVDRLPGFDEGIVSVQDEAAQLAAGLLELAPGQRVLDACAAPGGKTAHILEQEPGLSSLTAVEQDSVRFARLEETLARLDLGARLVCEDAAIPDKWWDGQCFDRILLDVPCSGSGVIRRHPDIKFHRRPEDIPKLTDTQARLLSTLWRLLASGGLLLYVTCSLLPAENQRQIHRFLTEHPDAREKPIRAAWGRNAQQGGNVYPGRQILPGEGDMDGFYYALLEKG